MLKDYAHLIDQDVSIRITGRLAAVQKIDGEYRILKVSHSSDKDGYYLVKIHGLEVSLNLTGERFKIVGVGFSDPVVGFRYLKDGELWSEPRFTSAKIGDPISVILRGVVREVTCLRHGAESVDVTIETPDGEWSTHCVTDSGIELELTDLAEPATSATPPEVDECDVYTSQCEPSPIDPAIIAAYRLAVELVGPLIERGDVDVVATLAGEILGHEFQRRATASAADL